MMTADSKDDDVMMTERPADYELGRGRPPVATRFKPSWSGNPKGRPKRSKNTVTLLDEILAEKVKIIENGRSRLITKRELGLRQLVNKSAGGDLKAMVFVVKFESEILAKETERASQANDLGFDSRQDEQLLEDYKRELPAQVKKNKQEDDDAGR